jgi:hypothetical protein
VGPSLGSEQVTLHAREGCSVTTFAFVDSSSAPTLEQARAVHEAGYRAWGIYLGAPGCTPHIWSPAEVEVLRRAGFAEVVPIWVPAQSFLEPLTNAPADALLALRAANARALGRIIYVDTEASARGRKASAADYFIAFKKALKVHSWQTGLYNGAALNPVGPGTWTPHYTPAAPVPAAGGAVQWAADRKIGGFMVDVSIADEAFPLGLLGPAGANVPAPVRLPARPGPPGILPADQGPQSAASASS